MHKISVFVATTCFLFFLSCSKDKPKTYAELILGKWNIVNQVYKSKTTGETRTDNYPAGSTVDFASNGAVVIRIDHDEDGTISPDEIETDTYAIESTNLKLGGSSTETYIIKTLTTTDFSFMQDEGSYETTINLKR